jgi:hypothetical protein
MHGQVLKSVYCHYNGYLDYTGEILNKHYDSVAANALIARGDNSGVKETIAEMNFYADRGEEGVHWQVAHSFEEFLDQVHRSGCEYYYILQEGVWYCGAVYDTQVLKKEQLVPLADALAALTVEKLVEEE